MKNKNGILKKKSVKIILLVVAVLLVLLLLFSFAAPIVVERFFGPSNSGGCVGEPCLYDLKPVIYLYPEEIQEVHVKLKYHGTIIADYPDYEEDLSGWKVQAYPDGKLINTADQKEYSYIFWEGNPADQIDWDIDEGFVVKGEDTEEFLREKLQQIGLSPKEYNEFVVFWYPLLKHNRYNLIHFADKQYTNTAQLTVSPQPDSVLRVFMVYKPLEEPVSIKEQEFETFERNGFTVVEWGGTMTP